MEPFTQLQSNIPGIGYKTSFREYPNIIYGYHTSLYNNLKPSTIGPLEKAIFYYQIGAFPVTYEIFDKLDPECTLRFSEPAVALEYGAMLWAQGVIKDAGEHFLKVLEKAELNGLDNTPFYKLVRLKLAITDFFAKGNFTRARDSMRETQKWLKDVSIEDYTDIQVQCICEYYMLGKAASFISFSFGPEQYGNIPHIPGKILGPWEGITFLREYLQSKGRLNEARCLAFREMEYFFCASAKEKIFESFIDACRKTPTSAEPVWLIEGLARLRWASKIPIKPEVAHQQINLAKRCFEIAPDQQIQELYKVLSLRIEILITAHLSTANKLEVYQNFVALADKAGANNMQNRNLEESALESAMDIASNMLEDMPNSDETLDRFYSIHSRLNIHLRRVGRIYTLLHNYNHILNQANRSGRYQHDTLQWWDQFQRDYPEFELWSVCYLAEESKMIQYLFIHDQVGAESTFTRREELLASDKRFWLDVTDPKKQDSSQQIWGAAGYYIDLAGCSSFVERTPEIKIWMRDTPFVLAHQRTMDSQSGSIAKPQDFLYTTVLEWLRDDLKKKAVSPREVHRMFPNHSSGSPNEEKVPEEVQLLLESLDGSAFRKLSLPTERSTFKPAIGVEVVNKWLFETSNYNLIDRHYIIARMQLDRALSFTNVVTNYEYNKASARETRSFLTLYPRLCGVVNSLTLFKNQVNMQLVRLSDILKMLCADDEKFQFQSKESYDRLRESLHHLFDALGKFRSCGDMINLAQTHIRIAQAHSMMLIRDPTYKLADGLYHIHAAEKVFNEIRQDYTLLRDVHALERYSAIWAFSSNFNPYRNGIYLLCVREVSDVSWRDFIIWKFIQKAKARALAEFMGIGQHFATQWIEKQHLSESARSMLSDEHDLVRCVQSASPTDAPTTRQLLRTHRAQMKAIPDLKPFLKLRTGAAFKMREMEEISACNAASKIFYVDWMEIAPGGVVSFMGITIAGAGVQPKGFPLDYLEAEVVAFLKQCSNDGSHWFLSTDVSTNQLQKLYFLISPIVEFTEPGDTLVFSPVGILQRIPLHAILVDGKPFIDRNPIVYAHSLSLLRRAFYSRMSFNSKNTSLSRAPVVVDVLNGWRPEHSTTLKSSTRTGVNVETYSGSAATPISLTTALISNRPFIHVLAHAQFPTHAPLDHHIILANNSIITARDLFTIKAENSYPFHISLICCESGAVSYSRDDESVVFGLVPAFIACGAASTISTLWKVNRKDGVDFSQHFYKSFTKYTSNTIEGPVVNLAKSLQKATLEMRKEEGKRGLYHWAAFILHGYWMMPLDKV